ncbi:helix-turn-helix domain-containing protein [Candidatus Peregrinibacteria bacterium]|nr:helix-turn-helix domain-containing protein [Candidatus Peregrinibacteria bacterium]
MKKIKIILSSDEILFLKKFKGGKGRTLRETNRVNILLLCHSGKREKDISEFLEVTADTIWRIKKRYTEGGVKKAIEESPRPGQPRRFSTDHQAKLTAIACSEAPGGRERWTIGLLTEKMRSGKNGCKTISRESVRLMLKKRI